MFVLPCHPVKLIDGFSVPQVMPEQEMTGNCLTLIGGQLEIVIRPVFDSNVSVLLL